MSSGSMTQEHREILRASRMLLAQKCRDQISPICEYLLEAEILTFCHKQVIESKSTAFEKVRTLLNILPERGDRAFDEFCNALTYCEITVENFNSGLGSILQESEISRKEETAMQNAMNPNQDEGRRRETFMYIADRIKSKKLKEFGRKLKLQPNDVDDIADTSDGRIDKCIHLLEAWNTTFTAEATFDVLLSVLKSCKETLIDDELK
ncbi:uncharacterized protein TRIADDRAFT_60656 [Trichoplax adhaerens]|uniref:Death domain-containing protein n=1 Tax=Trichoplax adhaerens TaxID=10228 RepID=B3S909_TRIAD|nr:hypothetical protein TRIADDRAFT_60656 [Trichoplax adhaerens]EDV20711.1 hypothetical protein TRIADDRAFT_60656 [Trichoplax adhaerens]|eukprot:XP_002116652.1 hypothetical protein TRIADDRAFT_60656 [Trichoplax adhaerens]